MWKVFVCLHSKNDFDNDNDITGVSHLYDVHVNVILVLAFQMKNRSILKDRKEQMSSIHDSLKEELQCICFRNDTGDSKSCTIRGGEVDENQH